MHAYIHTHTYTNTGIYTYVFPRQLETRVSSQRLKVASLNVDVVVTKSGCYYCVRHLYGAWTALGQGNTMWQT